MWHIICLQSVNVHFSGKKINKNDKRINLSRIKIHTIKVIKVHHFSSTKLGNNKIICMKIFIISWNWSKGCTLKSFILHMVILITSPKIFLLKFSSHFFLLNQKLYQEVAPCVCVWLSGL